MNKLNKAEEISKILENFSKEEQESILLLVVENLGSKLSLKKDSLGEFYDRVDPKTNSKTFACIAYFYKKMGKNSILKDDIINAFKEIGLSFDKKNFSRDMDAAKKQDLFLKDNEDEFILSRNGQRNIEQILQKDK